MPIPLAPPWTRMLSPGLQLTQLEDVRPDGEEGFRNGGRFAKAEARRDRQRLACRHGAVFGIAAAVGQRANAIAGRKRCDLRADLNNHARHLEAGHGVTPSGIGYRPWRCRISGRLTPAAFTSMSTSCSPDGGDLPFADLQYLRAARLADSNIFHGSSLSPVREMGHRHQEKRSGHPLLRGPASSALPGCLV